MTVPSSGIKSICLHWHFHVYHTNISLMHEAILIEPVFLVLYQDNETPFHGTKILFQHQFQQGAAMLN